MFESRDVFRTNSEYSVYMTCVNRIKKEGNTLKKNGEHTNRNLYKSSIFIMYLKTLDFLLKK